MSCGNVDTLHTIKYVDYSSHSSNSSIYYRKNLFACQSSSNSMKKYNIKIIIKSVYTCFTKMYAYGVKTIQCE